MEATLDPPRLTASDRCDGSQSEQALVLLEHPVTGEQLQFCGHHFAKYAEPLLDWIVLIDDRPRTLGAGA